MSDQIVCGYCGQPYREKENHGKACRYHPEFYFPYDIDTDGIHQKGWQCCGDTDSEAPGCTYSRHRSDVRRVYKRMSIAYHYEVIDPEVERRKEEEEAARKTARQKWLRDDRLQARVATIKSYKGRPLSEMESLTGDPEIVRDCYNGVSGYVDHSLTLFYAWEGIFFQVDTPYFSTRRSDIRPEERVVESLCFFASREEMEHANSELITDLS